MSTTQEERTRRAQYFAANSKSYWLMVRTDGRLWITAGRYTFDEVMSKHWLKSTPVSYISSIQLENLRAFYELRQGMREHQTGRRT